MQRVPLPLPALLALLALFFSAMLVPGLKLITFAPFLTVVFQRKSFVQALWAATLCGLCTDLITTDHRFGLYALFYLFSALITYRLKSLFFEEKIYSAPVFTLCFSALFSPLFLLFALFFKSPISITGKEMLGALLLMPLVDALYAFFWFTCPMMVYTYFSRRRWQRKERKRYIR